MQSQGAQPRSGPNLKPGVFKPGVSLAPFEILSTTWLNFDPEAALYPGPLARPWDKPKVLTSFVAQLDARQRKQLRRMLEK